MWGGRRKETFLIILASVDGGTLWGGGTYLSASRKMPKVKTPMSSGFKYTMTVKE